MPISFELKHPRATQEMLGLIPLFLSEHNPANALDQLHLAYGNMQYPGDPETILLAEGRLRDEIIRIYVRAWVAIVQPDGTFEVSRMD